MSNKECRCRTYDINRYKNKLSGPLLDRFDLFVEVGEISYSELNKKCQGEKSQDIRKRVEKARKIQKSRFENKNIYTNNEMTSKDIDKYCVLDDKSREITNKIFDKYKLSNRSYTKLIKISRTIADLEGEEKINSNNIMEAFSFRKAYYDYFR